MASMGYVEIARNARSKYQAQVEGNETGTILISAFTDIRFSSPFMNRVDPYIKTKPMLHEAGGESIL